MYVAIVVPPLVLTFISRPGCPTRAAARAARSGGRRRRRHRSHQRCRRSVGWRCFGGRVVYDAHEIYLEAAGRARLDLVRRAILRLAERRWVRRIDGSLTVNAALAAELARRDGLDPVVVRNCPP
ncbi:MAG TPA: hypothetical protein VGQ02_10255, partial [Candidatus Limnocylindrales bacterium]|nr:hypothetical protein [Candidatus Limnocylindrales bacterium]